MSRAQYITARHKARVHQHSIKPKKCDLCEFRTIYKSHERANAQAANAKEQKAREWFVEKILVMSVPAILIKTVRVFGIWLPLCLNFVKSSLMIAHLIHEYFKMSIPSRALLATSINYTPQTRTSTSTDLRRPPPTSNDLHHWPPPTSTDLRRPSPFPPERCECTNVYISITSFGFSPMGCPSQS